MTAALGRIDKMPKLEDVVPKVGNPKPPKVRSWQEQLAAVEMFVASQQAG